jgi:hypothetical protein
METHVEDNPVTGMNQAIYYIRIGVHLLLLIAILGPWTYTRDGAPQQGWECSSPHLLLENGDCVGLASGAEIFLLMNSGLLNISFLLIILLVQPFFSTLLLISGRDHIPRLKYNMLAWGLAGIPVGLILVDTSCYGLINPNLWGIWLFAGLVVSMLVVELLVFRLPNHRVI